MYPTFLDANKPLPGAPEKRWRPQDIPSDDSSQELHNWTEVDAAPRLSRSFRSLEADLWIGQTTRNWPPKQNEIWMPGENDSNLKGGKLQIV